MTLKEMFKKCDDDFLEFSRIPIDERRHKTRPDLCAFIYLDEKLGGSRDVVSRADYDKIWLSFKNLDKLTLEDVLYIHRCGVSYDEDDESLTMFT
jgi:hypothetical protein